MKDVIRLHATKDLRIGYYFHCPGCGMTHDVTIKRKGVQKPIWRFNGSEIRPTFKPSIKVTWGNKKGVQICHSWVTNGMIRFEKDSTHKLAGQTVALEAY